MMVKARFFGINLGQALEGIRSLTSATLLYRSIRDAALARQTRIMNRFHQYDFQPPIRNKPTLASVPLVCASGSESLKPFWMIPSSDTEMSFQALVDLSDGVFASQVGSGSLVQLITADGSIPAEPLIVQIPHRRNKAAYLCLGDGTAKADKDFLMEHPDAAVNTSEYKKMATRLA